MNASLKPPDLQQLLYISVSLVSLCVQSTILLMATSEEQASTTTWTDPEVNALLDFLLKNKSKIGESKSFTHQIYTRLQQITSSPIIPWVSKRQENHANQNSLPYVTFYFLKLGIANMSGCGWSPTTTKFRLGEQNQALIGITRGEQIFLVMLQNQSGRPTLEPKYVSCVL